VAPASRGRRRKIERETKASSKALKSFTSRD
jgi:hypothetical protein